MKVYIHHLETAVPEFIYPQEFVREHLESLIDDPRLVRIARQVFRKSGIDCRHSVLPDFLPGYTPRLYKFSPEGRVIEPSTQARNRCFIEAAGRLGLELVQRTLARADAFSPADITHVITVSCTGFYNPGLDYQIVAELGLRPTTQRYHLGFMGCYAAFPALRMARQFCLAQPGAVVLVVCVELCSLHLKMRADLDTILGNALFGDGAAAAIVSARTPSGKQPVFELLRFESALVPQGRGDMAWEIGDSGFNLVLSSYVPEILGANIPEIVGGLLSRDHLTPRDIDLWAIHPGGKAILDKIESALELHPEQLAPSREILRRFGNLSSATMLFILRELLTSPRDSGGAVCCMAFGPGLVVETGLLQLVPAGLEWNHQPEDKLCAQPPATY